MCVPGWEEAKIVAFPKGPEPFMGLLQPRTVIREEEKKNDGKRPAWRLCQSLPWQSPLVLLCAFEKDGAACSGLNSAPCPLWRQREPESSEELLTSVV